MAALQPSTQSPLDFRVLLLSGAGNNETLLEQTMKDLIRANGRPPGQHLHSRLLCEPKEVLTELHYWRPQLLHIYAHMASSTSTQSSGISRALEVGGDAPPHRQPSLMDIQHAYVDFSDYTANPITGELSRLLMTGHELKDYVTVYRRDSPLQCALLTGCHSEQLGHLLISAGVPYVVCTNSLVLDEDCLVYSRSFYTAVFQGRSIGVAHEEAWHHHALHFRGRAWPSVIRVGDRTVAVPKPDFQLLSSGGPDLILRPPGSESVVDPRFQGYFNHFVRAVGLQLRKDITPTSGRLHIVEVPLNKCQYVSQDSINFTAGRHGVVEVKEMGKRIFKRGHLYYDLPTCLATLGRAEQFAYDQFWRLLKEYIQMEQLEDVVLLMPWDTFDQLTNTS